MTTTETEIYHGYFIGGERLIRSVTGDELAYGYYKFRVHEFSDEATATAWLEAGTLP